MVEAAAAAAVVLAIIGGLVWLSVSLAGKAARRDAERQEQERHAEFQDRYQRALESNGVGSSDARRLVERLRAREARRDRPAPSDPARGDR